MAYSNKDRDGYKTGGGKTGSASAARAAKRSRKLVDIPKVSIEQFDGEVFKGLLLSVLTAGGALRIGTTRDGGAWAIGVYGDGPAPYTEYVKPDESLVEYFADLTEFFDELNNAK